jgi:hypothetical protein
MVALVLIPYLVRLLLREVEPVLHPLVQMLMVVAAEAAPPTEQPVVRQLPVRVLLGAMGLHTLTLEKLTAAVVVVGLAL